MITNKCKLYQIAILPAFLFLWQCTSSSESGPRKLENQPVKSGPPVLKFVKRVATDLQPKQVCLNPERDEFYITNLGGDKIAPRKEVYGPGSMQIFSLKDFSMIHREPARAGVECLIIDRDTLLYSDMFSDEISYFDLNERKVVDRVPMKESTLRNYSNGTYRLMPKVLTFSTDGKELLVSHWLDGLTLVDAVNRKFVKRIPKFCQHPRGSIFVTDTLVDVMCYGIPEEPGSIVRLNVEKDGQYKVVSRQVTGGSPRHIVPAGDGKHAYLSNLNSNSIYLYDLHRGAILKSLRIPGQPNTIVLDPQKRYLYVSLRRADAVAIIDTAEWKVVEKIKTGKFPTGLDVSPDGKWMAVTNFDEATVDLYLIEK